MAALLVLSEGKCCTCMGAQERRALHCRVSPLAHQLGCPSAAMSRILKPDLSCEHPYQLPGLPQALTTPILSAGCAATRVRYPGHCSLSHHTFLGVTEA